MRGQFLRKSSKLFANIVVRAIFALEHNLKIYIILHLYSKVSRKNIVNETKKPNYLKYFMAIRLSLKNLCYNFSLLRYIKIPVEKSNKSLETRHFASLRHRRFAFLHVIIVITINIAYILIVSNKGKYKILKHAP